MVLFLEMFHDASKGDVTQGAKTPAPLFAIFDHPLHLFYGTFLKVARGFDPECFTDSAEFAFEEMPFHIGSFATLHHVSTQKFSTSRTPLGISFRTLSKYVRVKKVKTLSVQ